MRNIVNLFNIYINKKHLELISIGNTNVILIETKRISLSDLLLFQKLDAYFDSAIIVISNLDELYNSNLDDYFNLIICFLIWKR